MILAGKLWVPQLPAKSHTQQHMFSQYRTLQVRGAQGCPHLLSLTVAQRVCRWCQQTILTSVTFSQKLRFLFRQGAYSAYFSIQKLLAAGGINWSVSYLYDKDGNLLSNDSALSVSFPVYITTRHYRDIQQMLQQTVIEVEHNHVRTHCAPGAAYCRPYFSVSSFTGTINIVNFLMWEYQ
jgi:hypothetical protein